MNDLFTGRKALRLRHFDHSESGMYFVTFCTHDRACVFGSVTADEMVLSEIGYIVEAGWKQLASHDARVGFDALVIPPNHLHGVANKSAQWALDRGNPDAVSAIDSANVVLLP